MDCSKQLGKLKIVEENETSNKLRKGLIRDWKDPGAKHFTKTSPNESTT